MLRFALGDIGRYRVVFLVLASRGGVGIVGALVSIVGVLFV